MRHASATCIARLLLIALAVCLFGAFVHAGDPDFSEIIGDCQLAQTVKERLVTGARLARNAERIARLGKRGVLSQAQLKLAALQKKRYFMAVLEKCAKEHAAAKGGKADVIIQMTGSFIELEKGGKGFRVGGAHPSDFDFIALGQHLQADGIESDRDKRHREQPAEEQDHEAAEAQCRIQPPRPRGVELGVDDAR